MIQEICKDERFLAQEAEPATPDDLPIAQDLIDTFTGWTAEIIQHEIDHCDGILI